MTTMLIACNETRESGSFCGDQLCSLKAAYLFVQNQPDVDKVILSVSPGNEMNFLWEKFISDPRGDGSIPPCTLVYDDWNPGDWSARFNAWDKWRTERHIEGKPFQHYRELYLRIHGALRQTLICGSERGLGRKNIYEYWLAGQENMPDTFLGTDWFDDTLINHPLHKPTRDVYISPHAKTQGNVTFTFDWWADVVHQLVDTDVTVTVGYDGWFCEDLNGHPYYKKHWGDHRQWMNEVSHHKLVACGNTGTGWLAAACGVPMITVEPYNSCMADHRYRECGLKNIVEVVDGHKLDEFGNNMALVAGYVAKRITDEVHRYVVLTTGCYDVLHAGHIRHLERAKALGTKLIVALNSDSSVRQLKGPERPINPQSQRKAVLEALRCVDEVRIFDGLDALPLLQELRPDVLACGYGYTVDKMVGRELVEGYGGKVVVTCYGDAKNEPPSTTKIVKRIRTADILEICREAASYSVNPAEKLKLLAEQVLSVKDIPGDMADLGACRGGTSLIMRRLVPDKHLHLFDTWEGTPYDDPLCHHKTGEWKAEYIACRILVGNDELTHYWQGMFPTTFTHNGVLHDGTQFAFVYVDSDTYQSVHDAIEFFWTRLVVGGKLMLDDYGWHACVGVKKAVDESFSQDQLQVIPNLYTCIVEKK